MRIAISKNLETHQMETDLTSVFAVANLFNSVYLFHSIGNLQYRIGLSNLNRMHISTKLLIYFKFLKYLVRVDFKIKDFHK